MLETLEFGNEIGKCDNSLMFEVNVYFVDPKLLHEYR